MELVVFAIGLSLLCFVGIGIVWKRVQTIRADLNKVMYMLSAASPELARKIVERSPSVKMPEQWLEDWPETVE